METNYGIVFSGDKEFKILAFWDRRKSKETLWDFANKIYAESFENKYEHYDTLSFVSIGEMNAFIAEQ